MDNGTDVNVRAFEEFCNYYKIKLITPLIYYYKVNGRIKRANRFILTKIRTLFVNG